MRLLRLLLASLLLVLPRAAHPAEPEIYGQGAFNSGPVACGVWSPGLPTTVYISNTNPFAIRVLRVAAWVGIDVGRQADIGFSAQRLSDGNLFFSYPADRYSNPGGSTIEYQDLSPGIVLQPGAQVFVTYYCAKLGTTATVGGQFAFNWWWIKEL